MQPDAGPPRHPLQVAEKGCTRALPGQQSSLTEQGKETSPQGTAAALHLLLTSALEQIGEESLWDFPRQFNS